MKILIGCDVDPILPPLLAHSPAADIWKPLDQIDNLVNLKGDSLPPITWLIRSDESVRFCTGSFASGYASRQDLWRGLVARGHELGWHMHHLTFDRRRASFRFDPDPPWFSAAHDSLAEHFPVRATRIGWDYGSTILFQRLDRLGVRIDFSALPGNIAWFRAGIDRVTVNWRRCAQRPYHPARSDYQKQGADSLRLIEVPVAQFSNSIAGMARRCAGRIGNRCLSMTGLRRKTLTIAVPWPALPALSGGIAAFFFHPEQLTESGIHHLVRNVERLRRLEGVEFVTAGQAVADCETAEKKGGA